MKMEIKGLADVIVIENDYGITNGIFRVTQSGEFFGKYVKLDLALASILEYYTTAPDEMKLTLFVD